MMRTQILSDCGHCSNGPSAVVDQSSARMRAPISPPPANTDSISGDRLMRSAMPGLQIPFIITYDLGSGGRSSWPARRWGITHRCERLRAERHRTGRVRKNTWRMDLLVSSHDHREELMKPTLGLVVGTAVVAALVAYSVPASEQGEGEAAPVYGVK